MSLNQLHFINLIHAYIVYVNVMSPRASPKQYKHGAREHRRSGFKHMTQH